MDRNEMSEFAGLATERVQTPSFSLQTIPDNEAALDQLGVDRPGSREIREILSRMGEESGLAGMINQRFAPITHQFRGTRYSDGWINVLYAALEEETARKEIEYQRDNSVDRKFEWRRTMVAVDFDGDTKDLRAKFPDWPELVSDDYKFCQSLGRQAAGIGLHGLLAPSARTTDGTTLPIFRRDAIVGARSVRVVVFPAQE